MSIDSASDQEIEQYRREQVQELAGEHGADWMKKYRPGSAGCHELLDRTAMLANIVESHILEHPACVARPDWYQLAQQAVAALNDLYQQVGGEHLSAENPGEGDVG